MIRYMLKRIFPVALLKRCFVVYNKVKKNTVDKLVYRAIRIPEKDFRIYHHEYPFRANHIDINSLQGSPAYPYMLSWMDWTQEEFLLEFDRACWIEPDYGWAIVPPNGLVFESFAFSRTDHQRKPNLFRFWFRRRISCQYIAKAISLRDSGEENYFHFYNDVLAKLFFLEKHGVDVRSIPVIISHKLWEKPYFQYYLQRSTLLQSIQWVVQRRQYIHCTHVIFCKPLTHSNGLWRLVVAPLLPRAIQTENRRIFITRHKSRLRFIENSSEIEAICRDYRYEIVDTDKLTPSQQIELFAGASHVVAIHGAGLTNMAFCPPGCHVLELFPPPELGYLPYHYILLAKMKGFSYRALIGGAPEMRFSGGFRIGAREFERALRELDS